MRAIGWIDVDLATNGRGLPSRCLADLAGRPLLARVVEGVLACPRLREVVVTFAPRDREAVQAALTGLPCRALAVEGPDLPNRALRRRARKWAGHSWRGGIASTYVYDEEGNLGRLYAAMIASEATHGVKFCACGPFVDTAMVEEMAAHAEAHVGIHDLTLSAAPPGLNYEVYGRDTVQKLVSARDTVRTSLAIRPGETTPDPMSFDFWFPLDVDIVASGVRLLADSARGEALVRGLVEAKGAAILRVPAREVLRALEERPELQWGRLPEEVEVEASCLQPFASDLRPSARRDVGLMSIDTARALAAQLSSEDDVRWTFGGIGDPLMHPRLAELIEAARRGGAYGVHVATMGVAMTPERARELAQADVDVVSVELTAATAEGYARLHRGGAEDFARGVAGVEALLAVKKDGAPLVLVEWVKARAQEGEFEAFYDAWAEKVDGVVVRGFCDYAGQVEDRGVMHLLPGKRGVCERLARRMSVLPNGDVTLCDMDYLGAHAIGNVHRDRLEDLWRGRCEEVRRAHARGELGAFPLCAACKDWAAL